MAIVFLCTECGRWNSAPEDFAGQQGICHACGKAILIPMPHADPVEVVGPLVPLYDPMSEIEEDDSVAWESHRWQSRRVQNARTWHAERWVAVALLMATAAAAGILLPMVFHSPREAADARSSLRRNIAKWKDDEAGVSAAMDRSDWQRVRCIEGHYSVSMPDVPTDGVMWVGPVKNYIRQVNLPAALTCTVAHTDPGSVELIAGTSVDDRLDQFCKLLREVLGGSVVSEEPISLAGHPGKEIAGRGIHASHEMGFRLRAYVVGDTIYWLYWLGQEDRGRSADVRRFLDSFRLE